MARITDEFLSWPTKYVLCIDSSTFSRIIYVVRDMISSKLVCSTSSQFSRRIRLLCGPLKCSSGYEGQKRPASSKNIWENSDPSLPKHFNFFNDVIKNWASEEAKRRKESLPAFYHVHENGKETKWSFRELVCRTEKTAGILKKCSLKRNDKIVIILPRVPEWWLITLAAIQLGIISSPGTTLLRSKDIIHRLNSFQPNCIFADYETAERIDQITQQCHKPSTKILCTDDSRQKDKWLNFSTLYEKSEPCAEVVKTEMHDPMNVFFTSGTTGFPKMVVQGHAMAYAFHDYLHWWPLVKPGDLTWSLADTGWAKTAWGSLFYPWTFGAGIFIYHASKFDPKTTADILQKYPINSLCAPPTAYKMLLKVDLSEYNFEHLNRCISAGELLTEAVVKEWEKRRGLYIDSLYGQTESPLLCSTYPCSIKKPGSIGIPRKDVNLAIVNDAGKEMAEGEEGDIGIKIKPYYPAGLFQGYSNNPEKTAETFRGDYYITGDRGYKDKDGCFWLVGRRDEIISSSGYRIGPFEIENALQEHPAVAEAAAIGVPDPLRGEIVKAFVVLKEDFLKVDKNEMAGILQNHAKTIMAPYKYPRQVEFVSELPKTISGKVQRFKLRTIQNDSVY